ncbi:GGDEF domain-containing protein, partial [Rhizobium sp. BR5]
TGTTIETSDFELWLRSAKTRRGKLPFRTIETSLNDGRWILTTETTLPGGWMLCVITDVSELGVELRDLRQERDRA